MAEQPRRSDSDKYPLLKAAIDAGRVGNSPLPKRELRCGPWIEEDGGLHRCQKCGRLDPLDFIEDDDA